MADYNDIKQSIATNLPDNNKREITAAKLRSTLNEFVDKVEATETGMEGKVSTNESNIGNLSGRMDTNETNVTNLTGRVDSLAETVGNLPSGGDNKVSINTLNLIDQSKIKTSTLINKDGTEVVGSWGDSYKCTGFIEVNHSDIICDNSIFINEVWPSYVVYDKQKRFLRAIFENSVYSYQSGDEYVRMNLYSSSTQNQANYGSVLSPYTPYNPIEGYITQLGLAKASEVYTKQQSDENFLAKDSPILNEKVNAAYINLIDKTQIKKGYILQSSGEERFIDGVNYGYTQNYIPVSENFTWNYALADGSNNTIVVYDKNKNRIRGISLPSSSVGRYIYQEGDAFIRVNFKSTIKDDVRGNYGDVLLDYTPYNPILGYLTDTGAAISNLDSRVTNIENKAYSTPFLTGMFNNCICIGDSITAGWREQVGDLKNYSYPATLKKLTNWEVTNAASGGQNAAGWMANTVYGGASQHDFSQHDIAIIFLGQNPEDDDSYRTNMQAIIDLLKNANPLIRIFMLVRSVSTTGHWGIAQELATSNNIPLFNIYSQEASIDLNDTLYHKMTSGSSTYDTVHFNTLGYNALGKVVFSFINDYIGSHQNEFKNVGDSVDL